MLRQQVTRQKVLTTTYYLLPVVLYGMSSTGTYVLQ